MSICMIRGLCKSIEGMSKMAVSGLSVICDGKDNITVQFMKLVC